MNDIKERNAALKLQIYTALLIICLPAVPVRSEAASAANEDNCRIAITAGLEQLRHVTPDMNRRDDEDRKKLLEEMERLVETNRQMGVSECQTWTQMMRKAFNQ